MNIVSEEQRVFEAMKSDLVRSHPGRFAVVVGDGLVGIFETVDEALLASSRAFDAGKLPEGAPIFISEIAERVSLRVTARPSTGAKNYDHDRDHVSLAGEIQV